MTTPESPAMTVLFFPCSHGAGFGYIGRALQIADEARAAGHNCVFASDTAEGLIARCGFTVHAAAGSHGISVPDMPAGRGEYIPFDNLDTVFGMMRYYRAERIRAHFAEDIAVIDAVRPDVVVIDMHPTAGIAARRCGIGVLSVADGDFLRDDANSWMPWVAPGTVKMPYPSCVPAFNQVLDDVRLPRIRHVTDLLWGSLTLLASTPSLESGLPPLHVRGPLAYVGPMHWDPPWSTVSDVLREHGRTADKRIYVTMGHGGKVRRHQVQTILDACDHEGWAVFISLGFRALDGTLRLPDNTRAGGFTGISEPIRWSDVVISHGGYATVLAGLEYGKPSIVIPFMSEQEANGRLFVEGQGAGFVLRKTVPSRSPSRHFAFDFRYSGPSPDGSLTADEVRCGLREIFTDERYADRAADAADALRETVRNRSFVPFLTQTAGRT